MNNWFHTVITNFSQHLNICSPKSEEWRCISPSPGYASGNSDWRLRGFWSFCCSCKPAGYSRWPRKDKYVMVSDICNRQKNA